MKNPKLSLLLGIFLCFLVGLLSYGPMLGNFFTDVDAFSLINSSRFENLSQVFDIFRSELMAGRMINAFYFRPLTSFMYGVEFHLFGLNPKGYHVFNLSLFLATSFLLILWARTLWPHPKGTWIGILAALFFLLHPIQVDIVPATARMGNLLSVFLAIFSLFSLAKFTFFKVKPHWFWYILSILASFLAILAKEPAIIIPGVLIIHLFIFSTEPLFKKRILKTLQLSIPLVTLTIFYLLWRWQILKGVGGYTTDSGDHSLLSTWETKATIIGHVLGFFFASLSDSFDIYSRWLFEQSWLVYSFFALTLTTLVLLTYFKAREVFITPFHPNQNDQTRDKRIFILFGCFLILHFFLLFVTFFHMRYLYLSMTVFSLLLAYVTFRLWELKKFNKLALMALILFPLIFAHSPLWNKKRLMRWTRGAEVSRDILSDLKETAQKNPEKILYVLNLPYTLVYGSSSPIFWELPFNQILMEHALRDYLSLISSSNGRQLSDIIVLNYLFFTDDPENIQINTEFLSEEKILVTINRGGVPSQFPWHQIEERKRYKDFFVTKGGKEPLTQEPPEGWPNHMEIQLLPKALKGKNPFFLVYQGKGLIEYSSK